ncbi:MAG TPA: glycosyl hydrolase [Acidimicrobiales bacterium]|nr:glycosyl hydrolase [Acidimicrobiales bacterium]
MFVAHLRKIAIASVLLSLTGTSLLFGAGATAATSGTTGIVAGLDTQAANDAHAISEIGRTPALINDFFPFQTGAGSTVAFPKSYADSVIALGSTPMITWLPSLATYKNVSVLTSLADGSLDPYLTSWASAAKAENHKVYVRLMHEFNGTWYPWGAVVAGQTKFPDGSGYYPYSNTPQMYVAAFRHVVQVFRNVGATNVEFIWCASSSAALSNLSAYFPGDSYIDWSGVDGYNRLTTKPRSLSTMLSKAYAAVTSFSTRPMMICETASVEFSGLTSDPTSKAQWITDAYLQLIPTYFPRVRAVNYFDYPGVYKSYQIDSSSASLSAVKQVFSSPLYLASAP